jgi:hypothetical protein
MQYDELVFILNLRPQGLWLMIWISWAISDEAMLV